ncbi:MAG: hypothetical protein H0A75_04075 [Candidatus Methanofishera endochildressiae]|uniref:Uncharacterized protein n=1 Tax=Candidatus Methanofishera endochildressiae TaxID=2738884 RepID=A0A7Z0SF14_9GAMM|nr:hypothetical protein [Candidatus Methanofishera endochildressiae]
MRKNDIEMIVFAAGVVGYNPQTTWIRRGGLIPHRWQSAVISILPGG